jgi:hypothetical protein
MKRGMEVCVRLPAALGVPGERLVWRGSAGMERERLEEAMGRLPCCMQTG